VKVPAPPLIITTGKQAKELCFDLSRRGPFGVDTETIGIDPTKDTPASGNGRIFCWSIAWHQGPTGKTERAYLPAAALPIFKEWLENPEIEKVGHNIFGFDRHIFLNEGINIRGIIGDTMHMSKLAYNHPEAKHGLKPLTKAILGYHMHELKALFSKPKRLINKVYKKEGSKCDSGPDVPTYVAPGKVCRFSKSRELIPFDVLEEHYPQRMQLLYDYASLDAKATLELFVYLRGKLQDIAWKPNSSMWDFYEQVWNPSLWVLGAAERNGFTLDADLCEMAIQEMGGEIDRQWEELLPWCGDINIRSWQQLGVFLYHDKGYPIPPIKGSMKAVQRTSVGDEPTSEAAINWLAENVDDDERVWLRRLLKHKKDRAYKKRVETYLDHLDVHGRVHYSLSPSTDTGRLAASNIAIQQVPKNGTLRKAFTAAEGHSLIVADYSQLELYILAHFLKRRFNCDTLGKDVSTGDIHSATAARHGLDRDFAKALNYSVNYGKGYRGLAAQLGITEEEAKEILQAYHAGYPTIKLFHDWCESYANRNGYIRTMLGRYRWIPELSSSNRFEYGVGYRKCINTPIQGSAADLVTMAMLKSNTLPGAPLNNRLFALNVKLLCQVHDELIFEVPAKHAEAALPLVVSAMEDPMDKPLFYGSPVTAVVCDNWADGK